MKGGGDAVSAARAVLQSGEFDFAWNLQVEDEILQQLEKGGKGRTHLHQGRRHRAHPAQQHRPLDRGRRRALEPQDQASDPERLRQVRRALALLVDKDSVEKHIYGRGGVATPNFINNPERFRSKSTKYEFNVDKAIDILEKAGWKKGADGIREKDGKKLKLRLPDLDQPAAPEEPGDRQAGLPEGRHRDRAEGGDGIGVLLVRRRQPGHLHASSTATCRCTTTAPSPTPRSSCASSARGRRPARTTSGRAATSRAGRTRNTTTSHKAAQVEVDPIKRAATADQAERAGDQQHRGDPGGGPPRRRRRQQQARRRAHRLGQQHLGPARTGIARPESSTRLEAAL